jgi:hypothetical protein
VCFAFGEVPNIAFVQYFVLVAAILVNSAYGDLTVVDVAPFRDAVPVELANAAFGQVLLGAGDVVAGWEVGDDLFSDPAARELASFGVGETPFEVLYCACVGGFLA